MIRRCLGAYFAATGFAFLLAAIWLVSYAQWAMSREGQQNHSPNNTARISTEH